MATPIRTGGPVEMIEEAVHLLRGAPAGAIAAYLAGSVPFLVGCLFFWTEMSRSRSADADSFFEAFGMAVLFLWMSGWKAVFAGRLRRQLEGAGEPPWTWRRAWGVFVVQAGVQPLKLVLMPMALVAILPAAPLCAFFRNVTALADGGQRPGEVLRQARRQASLWQRENWIALAILFAFSLIVFLNVALTLLLLPQLVRMLTGYESEFARSGVLFAANWTFFAVAAGVTWLCVDAFVQAFYVLRCFLGQAIGTGADLKAELRALRAAAVLVVLLACCGVSAFGGTGLRPVVVRPEACPTVTALDRSIDEVLARSEYRWRLPRAAPAGRPFGSGILKFTEQATEYLRRGVRFVEKWADRLMRWLRDLLGSAQPGDQRSGPAPSGLLRVSLLLLAALAAGAAVALFLRSRSRRARRPATGALAPAVDLSDESLVASQLPEETWLALAEEWTGKRDLRMALRALYLGTLAYLGRTGLVVIHACKSNREYEGELRRKSRATPEIPPLFLENLGSFERSWYGRHEVLAEEVGQFRANLDRIKAAGGEQ
ncbi:MAG: hypothetical protein ABSH46_11765 [Bryobacteraceae bacterium]|jgi:hypothetical protein